MTPSTERWAPLVGSGGGTCPPLILPIRHRCRPSDSAPVSKGISSSEMKLIYQLLAQLAALTTTYWQFLAFSARRCSVGSLSIAGPAKPAAVVAEAAVQAAAAPVVAV